MRLYYNVYDYAIYIYIIMKINILLVFLRALSTKQNIITMRISKYMYDQNTYILPLFFYLRTLLWILKHWKY